MVKFGKELLNEEIAEWQPYYMSYNKLKGFLQDMAANTSDDGIDKFFEAREGFFEELKINLKRVDQFYANREKFLHTMLREALENATDEDSDEKRQEKGQTMCDEVEKLKQFAFMNHEGFRKITKKYDKRVGAFEQRHRPRDMDNEQMSSLKDRTLQLLTRYAFTNSEDRLEAYYSAMEAYRDKQEVRLPPQKFTMGRRVSIADNDLDVPLMGYKEPRKSKSAAFRRFRQKMFLALRQNLLHAILLVILTAVELYCWWTVLEPKLKFTGYATIWVTYVSLVLLVRQYPPEAVMVTATLILTIFGIIDKKLAWAAFSSEVVLSVAGLGAIASCVGSTGVIDKVFTKIVGKPKILWVAMLRLIIPATILNCGVSNTCVMSCLLPVIDQWSEEIGHHKAFFLMPLSYILLCSGAVATFSTSTNLVAQQLLQNHGDPLGGFGMFDLAVPVLVCVFGIVVYLLIMGPLILRRFAIKEGEQLSPKLRSGKSMMRRGDNRFDIRVQINGRALVNQTLSKSGILKKLSGGFNDIVHCERFGEIILPDEDGLENGSSSFVLQLSDVLILNTTHESMVQMRNNTPGVSLIPQDCSEIKVKGDYSTRELVEVVLDKSCPLVSHRMRHTTKYSKYGVSIVAFRAFNDKAYNPQEPPQERRLQQGDHLVFDCPPEFYENWNDSSDFVFARRILKGKGCESDLPTYAATLSGFIMLCMIALVASSTLKLTEGVLSCLTALVFTRCCSFETVIKAVKLRTVLTIVGAFGLGQAIRTENIADVMATALLHALGWAGPRGILLAIFCATIALGVVFHGTAVVVLMFPICQTAAAAMQPPMPLHQVIALLCIAVTGQMLSPISYQTNLMAYNDGGYEFADFTKTGLGCVIILAVCSIYMCELWFPADDVPSTIQTATFI